MAEIKSYEQNVSRYKTILNRAREIVEKEGSESLLREPGFAKKKSRQIFANTKYY